MNIEEIYEKYFANVYRFARKLSGNSLLAEELTQETFFAALKHIDKFRGDCDIRVWLCQICKNCYYGHLRKGKRIENVPAESLDEIQASDNVESYVIEKDETYRIHQILHDMDEPYKEVFTLRTFGELSFNEICGLFGKSENWARVTYFRARKKIAEELFDEDNV